MSDEYRFDVQGTPVPQGSKRAFVVNGRAVIADVKGKELKAWRKLLTDAADEVAPATPLVGAVEVRAVFWIERPKSVKRDLPHVRPDADKLVRALGDALTSSGLYTDDSQITDLLIRKRYRDAPGVSVVVRSVVEP